MDEINIKLESIYDNPFTYFTEQLNKIELYLFQNSIINEDIPYYKELEEKLFEYISQIPSVDDLQKKRFKKELLKFLKERFELNEYNQSFHCMFQVRIEMLFNQYMANGFDCSVELFTFCEDTSSKASTKIKTFFEYLRRIKESDFSAYIKESMQLNYSIPRFLLINHSKVIKQKISIIWRMNNIHSYNAQWKLDGNEEYKFLYHQYRDFYDGKSNLFDEKFLNKTTLSLLFQALVYSNGESLKHNSNVKIFLHNSRRYLDLMGFERETHSSMVATCYDFIRNNTIDQIEAKLIDVFTELSNQIGLSQDGKLNDQILYIIFCVSCVMNNIIAADIENKIKAVFVSKLKCSAKERQFLLNFLIKYDTFIQSVSNKCVFANSLIEKYVLSALIKSYTKVLYDQQNATKINFTYQRIIYLLNQNSKSSQNCEEEYIFSPLNEIEQAEFAMHFSEFKSYINESEPKPQSPNANGKAKNFFSKIGNKISKHIPNNKPPLIKNKLTHILYPTDPLCVSIHICICISGIFYQDDSLELNDSSIWSNIINNKQNVDYYVYDWQNADNLVKPGKKRIKNILSLVQSTKVDNAYETSIAKENKRVSKKFGRLLAYIIASRSVFKFHTISLIGFALGCNVIKYCLKELNKLNVDINVSDIIYNVIFIGGATTLSDKHKDLFTIVSGNVYNFYSRCDNKLSDYYSEEAIGSKGLSYDNDETNKDEKSNEEITYPKFINIDLTANKFKQSVYGIGLNKLLKHIKIH